MRPVLIYGLAFKCPFEDEYEGCPFVSIRSMNNFKKQYEAIEELTEKEKLEKLSFHWLCKKTHEKRLNSIRIDG